MVKETFIIRTEWYKSISKLGIEEKAILLDNLFNYHNLNDNLINLNNPMVDLVWGLIEPNLRRNIESYDARKQSSVENGKLGGRPKKEVKSDENNLNNLNKPNDKTQEPNETLSVFVSVSDSVSDSDSEIVSEEINTAASPFFSNSPFTEIEDESLKNQEEEKRKKVAPKKEKEPIPELYEFLNYAESQLKEKFEEMEFALELKYKAWVENDWKDGNNKNITRWKLKLLNTIPFLQAKPKPKEAQQPISKTEALFNQTSQILNKYQ